MLSQILNKVYLFFKKKWALNNFTYNLLTTHWKEEKEYRCCGSSVGEIIIGKERNKYNIQWIR